MLLIVFSIIIFFLFFIISKKTVSLGLPVIVLLALFVRITSILLFINASNFDLSSYKIIGALILNHINIYPYYANLHHPYLPFFLYIEALALYLQKFINPILFLKIIFAIFDIGILLVLYYLSGGKKQVAALYAFNPISILVVCVHGQFDTIPLFFFILSIFLLRAKKDFLAVLFYSFSILTKTWPILFFAPFLKKIRKKWLFLFVSIFPIIFVILYIYLFELNIRGVRNMFWTFRSYYGVLGWGIGKILVAFKMRMDAISTKLVIDLILLTYVIISLLYKERRVIKGFLITILLFFIMSPTYGLQWLLWPLPFLLLIKPKFWEMYVLLVTICLTTAFYGEIYKISITIANTLTSLELILIWCLIIVIAKSEIARN